METCRPRRRGCPPADMEGKRNLGALVARFKRDYIGGLREEMQFFRRLPSVDLLIYHVAMARDENDRCFEHQFRILRVARVKAREILGASFERLRSCESFEALHGLLVELFAPVHGLGELYIYDAAVRLGAYLGLSPKLIYLHAGTRKGAAALGLGAGRTYLEKRDLPAPLRLLTADQIETFLCCFKDVL